MDPFVEMNRKSREMIYSQVDIANERESKKLAQELKNLDNQQQRSLFKLEKETSRIKSASSMPCLLTTGRENSGLFLSPSTSPRASISLPVSPVCSPRLTRCRHHSIENLSCHKTQHMSNIFCKKEGIATSRRAKSEERLNPRGGELHKRELKIPGVTPNVFRKSYVIQSTVQDVSVNTSRTNLQGNKSRRKLSAGCVPMMAIDENRDNLDQRIRKFHESLKVLEGKNAQDVEERDQTRDEHETRESHNNVPPKLPEITTNSKRSRSLPTLLIPRLSLVNLKCELSTSDGCQNDLHKCRYLRVRETDESKVKEMLSCQKR